MRSAIPRLLSTPIQVAMIPFALAFHLTRNPKSLEDTPRQDKWLDAYDISIPSLEGKTIHLADFKNRPVLVVNTASKCGFSAQLGELQTLYTRYVEQGLVVLGIPSKDFLAQEYSDPDKTADFCQRNYGVDFPMAAIQHVKGSDAHSFYKWAKSNHGRSAVPRWNFHKILLGVDGTIANTFNTRVSPLDASVIDAIEAQLLNMQNKCPQPQSI